MTKDGIDISTLTVSEMVELLNALVLSLDLDPGDNNLNELLELFKEREEIRES